MIGKSVSACTFLFAPLVASCAVPANPTREIVFPYDPGNEAAANYAAFQATAKKECRARDIRRVDGIGGEYNCRAVLLDRAVAAANDSSLQQIHREQDGVRVSNLGERR